MEPWSLAIAGGCVSPWTVMLHWPRSLGGLSHLLRKGTSEAPRSRGRSSLGVSCHVLLCRRVGWHRPLRSPGSSSMRRDGWRGHSPQTPNGPRGLSARSVLPRFPTVALKTLHPGKPLGSWQTEMVAHPTWEECTCGSGPLTRCHIRGAERSAGPQISSFGSIRNSSFGGKLWF